MRLAGGLLMDCWRRTAVVKIQFKSHNLEAITKNVKRRKSLDSSRAVSLDIVILQDSTWKSISVSLDTNKHDRDILKDSFDTP